jgi:cytochrome P450
MAPEPPMYPGLPLIGSLLDLRGDRAALMRRAAAEVGPIVRFRVGPRTITVVADPDALGEILLRRHLAYVKQTRAYRMMRDGLGDGLLTSDGAQWQRQRRIAGPSFRGDAITGFAPLMVSRATALARRWAAEAGGVPVDVVPALHRLAMRIAGEAFLGADVGPEADTIRTCFDQAIRITTQRVLSPLATPIWVPTPTNIRLRRCLGALDRVLGGLIDAHRRRLADGDADPADPAHHAHFLHRLMAARDDQTGEAMSDAQLLDEVKTLFIAGFETTSNALAWTVYELGRSPAWQARVREEARAADLEGDPVGALARLPLARRVFLESLRRYPPIWAVGRNPLADEVVGGFTLKAGSWVFPSPLVVHHDPRHWPDPERWDPDRFLPERAEGRHKHAFLPFTLGPRRCIGEHFAMMEGVLIVASLAAGVRWTHDEAPVRPEPVVTLRPSRPVRLTIHGP